MHGTAIVSMKIKATRFKSLKVALRELEQFIRDGAQVLRGKPLKRFGNARPRELLGNWLQAVVANAETGTEDYTFTSDPNGDGIIYNLREGKDWPTEHVIVPPGSPNDLDGTDARILEQIQKKQRKGGTQYARGKTLVVFNEIGNNEAWHPNKVASRLPKSDFKEIWVVGLHSVSDGQYTYGVTVLDRNLVSMPIWKVEINKDFTDWVVTRIQTPSRVQVSYTVTGVSSDTDAAE